MAAHADHRSDDAGIVLDLCDDDRLRAALPPALTIMTKPELVEFEREFQAKLSSAAPILWRPSPDYGHTRTRALIACTHRAFEPWIKYGPWSMRSIRSRSMC